MFNCIRASTPAKGRRNTSGGRSRKWMCVIAKASVRMEPRAWIFGASRNHRIVRSSNRRSVQLITRNFAAERWTQEMIESRCPIQSSNLTVQ
uniref:Uncharacterized protein n=1 Tax=Physcomitrium patens TaxID=3218 RepID=A0A2K1J2R7_PHYPA|nr:hypothetical protein PHYPA_021669 [Physcomitrium patens]